LDLNLMMSYPLKLSLKCSSHKMDAHL